MYNYYLRLILGRNNYEWLRNMFYSLSQQLMRQDPLYYAYYMLLRPDYLIQLVSYLYYNKKIVKGDLTEFKHVDLNIQEMLVDRRGINQIQGSVSLDNKAPDNCTTILLGIYRHLKAQQKRVKRRGLLKEGRVIKVTDQTFNQQDKRDFQTDQTPVLCKKGAVQIIMPYLPYSALGLVKGVRRTILLQFVGLQEDH